MGDPIELLYLLFWPGMIVLPAGGLLVIGWSHRRAGRYPLASVFATATWAWSWALLALEAPVVIIFVLEGARPWEHPLEIALLSYPPMVWVIARMLRASIAEHSEMDRFAAMAFREGEREERNDGNR